MISSFLSFILCVKSVTGVIIWKMQTLFTDFPIQYKNKINDSHVRNNNNFLWHGFLASQTGVFVGRDETSAWVANGFQVTQDQEIQMSYPWIPDTNPYN